MIHCFEDQVIHKSGKPSLAIYWSFERMAVRWYKAEMDSPYNTLQENLEPPQRLFLPYADHLIASKTIQNNEQHALLYCLLDRGGPAVKRELFAMCMYLAPHINPVVILWLVEMIRECNIRLKLELLTRKLTDTPSSSPRDRDLSKQFIAASALLIDSAW